MAAIITDQLRIKNARTFIDKIRSSTDSYYTFIGLPNAVENTIIEVVNALIEPMCFTP